MTKSDINNTDHVALEAIVVNNGAIVEKAKYATIKKGGISMTFTLFEKSNGTDEDYLRWLIQHPEGFVVNTKKNISPNYMVLHRASCSLINPNRKGTGEGAFTQKQYIKICADDIESLRGWVKDHGRSNGSFSKECATCKPI